MLEFLSVFVQYSGQWGPRLAQAAVVSAQISVMGFLVATAFGLALALMRLSQSRLLQLIAKAYIIFFRGVPVLAVLLLIYFGLPGVGILFSPIEAAVIGLGLAYAAQMAAEAAGREAIEKFDMKRIAVIISGPGPGTDSAIRSLRNVGFEKLTR